LSSLSGKDNKVICLLYISRPEDVGVERQNTLYMST